MLVVAGGLDLAVIRGGVGGEVTLGSLNLGTSLGGVEVDLGSVDGGTSHGVAIVVSGAGSVSLTALDTNGWGLEADIGGVDFHAGTVGADTNGGSVHAGGTTVGTSGEIGAVDVEVLLRALGLEGTRGSVRVVVNGWLLVVEGTVLVIGSAGGSVIAGSSRADASAISTNLGVCLLYTSDAADE